MAKIFILSVLCVVAVFNIGVDSFKIDVIRDCDDPKAPPIQGLITETKVNPDNTFTGRLKLPFPIDDSIMFTSSFSTFDDGKWKKESFELSGDLCGGLNTYIPTLWKRIANAVNIPSKCPIAAGDYTLTKFAVSEDDIDMPLELTSKIMVQSIYTKDDKIIMCKEMEISP